MPAEAPPPPETEAPQTTPLYVYGVLAEDAAVPEGNGIDGQRVTRVTEQGLAALVSPLPDAEQVALGREEVTMHAEVLEQALERGTVLPMRFGVVMAGEEDVREQLLHAHHEELVAQLQELQGKIELRLRAVYEEQTLMREVVAEDPGIAQLRQEIQGQPEDATYYARIQLGERVAEAVRAKADADADELLSLLGPLALDVHVSEPGHERVALNASFLVPRERVEEFDRAVDGIGERQQTRMRLKYTGPLPPYSFVELDTGA